jgi:hypothetical protein
MRFLTNKVFKVFLFLAVFFMVERFCHHQTKGFWITKIKTDLTYDEKIATSIPVEEKENVQKILSQKFYFFGHGGQAYAFLSEDGKTVFKIFKQHHLNSRTKRDAFLQSCKIAFDEMREESGLLYVHLNPTNELRQKIILVDNIGIAHKVDLDGLQFIVQKKAEMVFRRIKQQIRQRDFEEAKNGISAILELIALRCRKGIKDNDTGIYRNLGYLNHKAIAVDIGSFSRDESLKDRAMMEAELRIKTERLERLLKRSSPMLLEFYEEKIKALAS